jgi:hypothetical protein
MKELSFVFYFNFCRCGIGDALSQKEKQQGS